MKIVFKNIFIYSFGFFVLIQIFQVTITNTPTIEAYEIKAPKKVMQVFKTSCYDCHSNSVNLPWYSHIAPISWSISRHITLGRKWLNFSIWETYTPQQQDKKLQEIYKAIYKAMPLQSYLYKHPEAKLSKKQRDMIRAWTGKAPF
jgi:hypothetical protein